MTTYLAIDTCVWINIASRPALWGALTHLEAVVGSGAARLVVPAIVRSELGRHLPETPDRAVKSMISQVRNAKAAASWIADQAAATKATGAFDEVLAHLAGGGQQVQDMTARIIGLLDAGSSIQIDTATAGMKGAALDRALAKRAPCHNAKNNIADALIVEACLSFAQGMGQGDSLVLASDNTKEFADPKDQRVFHPELRTDFSAYPVTYSMNVAETVGGIDPAQADEPLVVRYQESVAERTAMCTDCNVEMHGHWFNSQFGGGLSWHFTCPKCHRRFDTGDYYD